VREASPTMAQRFAMTILVLLGLVCLTFGLLELIGHSRLLLGHNFHVSIVPSNWGNRIGWLFMAFALPLFVVPILAFRGTLAFEYHQASRAEKIRSDIVTCLLSIPVMFVLISFASPAECNARLHCGKLAILLVIYLAFFGMRLTQWRRKKGNESRT